MKHSTDIRINHRLRNRQLCNRQLCNLWLCNRQLRNRRLRSHVATLPCESAGSPGRQGARLAHQYTPARQVYTGARELERSWELGAGMGAGAGAGAVKWLQRGWAGWAGWGLKLELSAFGLVLAQREGRAAAD